MTCSNGILALLLLFVTSCGGTPLLPTSPSLGLTPPVSAATSSPVATPTTTLPAPAPVPAPAPRAAGSIASGAPISGTVRPVNEDNPPCWADRYACEAYTFALAGEGNIGVTLTWEGAPRAMMVQLYWGDGLIAHEDISRSGTANISFNRPAMEASGYRIRVVSMEPASTIPFTLTVNY